MNLGTSFVDINIVDVGKTRFADNTISSNSVVFATRIPKVDSDFEKEIAQTTAPYKPSITNTPMPGYIFFRYCSYHK